MTVTTQDVLHLADLARIATSEEEAAALATDMDSILGYVQAVEQIAADIPQDTRPALRNVFREDEVTNTSGEYTSSIVAQFPEKEGDALKVQKIL
jgi:aspartyl-tRNA(Asn)/glutamyl-tRNA(Gln) amidotransferase subunit C